MKFCAGWLDGEIWLNQIQDGTSFGVYEISAKNNNVPTKSRMRAKTSLQALCLSVRATASDSNSMPASFNLVVTARSAVAPYPSLSACRPRATLITVPRIMRVSLAKAASIVGATAVIAVCSCEKHPLGQMPEVQREQTDPATKVWSEKSETEKSESAPTPAEAVPH